MIDFHSHVLPRLDDGSRSSKESIDILSKLYKQGVDYVCATPHFDAGSVSPELFIKRRQASYDRLVSVIPEDVEIPQILLGSEIAYFKGISRASDLKQLTIGDSNLLLVEMPPEKWTEYMQQELVEICACSGMRVIIAHLERCYKYQRPQTLEYLIRSGVLMQANASFFTKRRHRAKALRMLANGKIHLLGTDCHNSTSRPPRADKALSVIRKRFGDDFVSNMDKQTKELLIP